MGRQQHGHWAHGLPGLVRAEPGPGATGRGRRATARAEEDLQRRGVHASARVLPAPGSMQMGQETL